MDLALNNLQKLICHKTQQTKPTTTILQVTTRTYYNLNCFRHVIYSQQTCTYPNSAQFLTHPSKMFSDQTIFYNNEQFVLFDTFFVYLTSTTLKQKDMQNDY